MDVLYKNTRAYKLLEAEADSRSLSHAYLLLMDDTKNLREVAKLFAKPFFGCHKSVLSAKNARISELIDTEGYTDCLFYPETGKKLDVAQTARMEGEFLLRPVEGNAKLFVIADFSEANAQVQNKLLKSLEEPPEGVYFLLCASNTFALLPTVLSRVKKLEIQPFGERELAEALTRIYEGRFSKEEIAVCSACAGGSLGNAQNILEGGAWKTLSDNAFAVALATPQQIPSVVKQVGDTKRKKELLSLLRNLFRDATLLKTSEVKGASLKHNVFLKTERINLSKIAQKYSLAMLLSAQDYLSEAEFDVNFNAYFPQCIELFMAKINNG